MKRNAGREVLTPQRKEEFAWYLYTDRRVRPIRLKPSYLRVRRSAASTDRVVSPQRSDPGQARRAQ